MINEILSNFKQKWTETLERTDQSLSGKQIPISNDVDMIFFICSVECISKVRQISSG